MIKKEVEGLRQEKFKIEYQGNIADYLGFDFENLPDEKIKMTQPHLIDQIVQEVGINSKMIGTSTPAASTKICQRTKEDVPVYHRFNYRKVVGKLNFLGKYSRTDIVYASHQCFRFSDNPYQNHADTMVYLARYLRDTKDKWIILCSDK